MMCVHVAVLRNRRPTGSVSTRSVCFRGIERWIVALAVLGAPVTAQETTRASVTSSGEEAEGNSYEAALSADGRFVAFYSLSFSFAPFFTFGVFVHDRFTLTTELVSLSTAGVPNNGNTGNGTPDLSADGRYVAFISDSTNLVTPDTNGTHDVFVRDRLAGITTLVSRSSGGVQGNGQSLGPVITADGRYVAFTSTASNLVAGDTNGARDIFLHDRLAGQTTRVNVSSAGAQANMLSDWVDISSDGRYVVFGSVASNLVAGDGPSWDCFVRDTLTNTTTLISTSSSGVVGNGLSTPGAISADGRYVAFQSLATNLVAGDTNGLADIFVKDRQTGATTLVSVGVGGIPALGGPSGVWHSSISADGRYVAFESSASNLVASDLNGWSDVFVRDRQLGQTTRVSVATGGSEGDENSFGQLAISADGRLVAYSSRATNLVPSDLPSSGGSDPFDIDVFVHDREAVTWTDLGFGLVGSGDAAIPLLSGHGHLAAGSTNHLQLSKAKPLAAATIVVGFAPLFAPFKGGTLVPHPTFVLTLFTNTAGKVSLTFVWPAGAPAGTGVYFQYWIQDQAGPQGFAASNGLKGTTP
jgi:Tol biopolymer transport system component